MAFSRERFVRLLVWAAVIGWGVSLLGTLLPWNMMEFLLQGMGKEFATDDPMIRYWFRMAAGGWTVIGFLFLCCALKPREYAALLPLLAWGSLFEGVVLLFHGLALGLPLFPFLGDAAFCLAVGAGILLAGNKKEGDMREGRKF
ncbi:MAG: hypothetical protein HPZ91_02715 [Lentisphaeria bacterium]|nr:hypothetical protein [Lentisphaeria bacterium]